MIRLPKSQLDKLRPAVPKPVPQQAPAPRPEPPAPVPPVSPPAPALDSRQGALIERLIETLQAAQTPTVDVVARTPDPRPIEVTVVRDREGLIQSFRIRPLLDS